MLPRAGHRPAVPTGVGAWVTTVVRVVTGVLFVTLLDRQVLRPHDRSRRRLRPLRRPVARGRRLPRRDGGARRRVAARGRAPHPAVAALILAVNMVGAIATAGRVDGGTSTSASPPPCSWRCCSSCGRDRAPTRSTPSSLAMRGTRSRVLSQPSSRSRATASQICVDSASDSWSTARRCRGTSCAKSSYGSRWENSPKP